MKTANRFAITITLLALALPVFAADDATAPNEDEQPAAHSLPGTPLVDVLDAVSRKSGEVFLVSRDVFPDVVVGQLRTKDVTYTTLLTILRNNGLAAVSIGDIVNIVPEPEIRQYPSPVLYADDDSIADEQWVTRVLRLENAEAPHMVPIMRPLLPRAGHMAANPESNTIVLVDRYANVRRITELVLKMDALTPSAKKQ